MPPSSPDSRGLWTGPPSPTCPFRHGVSLPLNLGMCAAIWPPSLAIFSIAPRLVTRHFLIPGENPSALTAWGNCYEKPKLLSQIPESPQYPILNSRSLFSKIPLSWHKGGKAPETPGNGWATEGLGPSLIVGKVCLVCSILICSAVFVRSSERPLRDLKQNPI